MKLIKKNIHMNKIINKVTTQITLDDDFIVPDVKPDIDRIVAKDSKVIFDKYLVNDGKVLVSGSLCFNILYGCEGELDNLKGSIVFDEQINSEDISEGENIDLHCVVESVTLGIINTRKISVKAVIAVTVTSDEIYDIETAVDIEEDTKVDTLKKKTAIAQVIVSKKDILRVKEEIDIPSNKSNVSQLLWNKLELTELLVRPLNGSINISGEMSFFGVYAPQDEAISYQCIDNVVPFSANIELSGCEDDMVPHIEAEVGDVNVEVRSDYDGEPRIIAIDAVLKLNIKVYDEIELDYLEDIYACGRGLEPVYEDVIYNKLLLKSISKCKISDKVKLDASVGNILQICNTSGEARITSMSMVENGIEINGFLLVSIMYISDDDRNPYSMANGKIAFTYLIEIPQINENSIYKVHIGSVKADASMSSGYELDIKAAIVFDTLVLDSIKGMVMVDVVEKPLDLEKLLAMPGIVGYLVKTGDTLWKIAKEFYTTVDSIKEINGLKSDMIKAGDMLIIVKNII